MIFANISNFHIYPGSYFCANFVIEKWLNCQNNDQNIFRWLGLSTLMLFFVYVPICHDKTELTCHVMSNCIIGLTGSFTQSETHCTDLQLISSSVATARHRYDIKTWLIVGIFFQVTSMLQVEAMEQYSTTCLNQTGVVLTIWTVYFGLWLERPDSL